MSLKELLEPLTQSAPPPPPIDELMKRAADRRTHRRRRAAALLGAVLVVALLGVFSQRGQQRSDQRVGTATSPTPTALPAYKKPLFESYPLADPGNLTLTVDEAT